MSVYTCKGSVLYKYVTYIKLCVPLWVYGSTYAFISINTLKCLINFLHCVLVGIGLSDTLCVFDFEHIPAPQIYSVELR